MSAFLRPLLRVGWAPSLVFTAHCVLSLGFNAYDRLAWLDVLMHFLGGAAIAYFFDGVLHELRDRDFLAVGSRASMLVSVLGLVALSVVAWEFAEFLADTFFDAGAQRSLANTMKDQFIGLAGGAVYVRFAARDIERKAGDWRAPVRLAASLAAFMIMISVSATAVGSAMSQTRLYHGPSAEPAAWNPRTDRQKIVQEARKLVGLLYDPVQGYFNNAGGRLGFIVCMDVPRLAYRNAGASLRALLEADYKAHPEHYGKRDGRPGDPYFDRRARNLYSYCKFNGCLDLTGPPAPGDVVFMSHGPTGWISHIALVSEVRPDGTYRVVEASRDEWYVTREEDSERMFARGWAFRGFGRPLPSASGRRSERSLQN